MRSKSFNYEDLVNQYKKELQNDEELMEKIEIRLLKRHADQSEKHERAIN